MFTCTEERTDRYLSILAQRATMLNILQTQIHPCKILQALGRSYFSAVIVLVHIHIDFCKILSAIQRPTQGGSITVTPVMQDNKTKYFLHDYY